MERHATSAQTTATSTAGPATAPIDDAVLWSGWRETTNGARTAVVTAAHGRTINQAVRLGLPPTAR